MTAITRRRGGSTEDEAEERDTRRSRRSSRDEEPEERSSRRRSSRDDDDEPRRSRRSSRDEDEPRSRRSSRSRDDDDERGSSRRGGRSTAGFAAYSAKKRTTSTYADEFKPGDNTPTLIKIMDAEPFDSYNQHWVDEGDAHGKGKRHSFVCRDDEYFSDDDGCPLCEIGWPAKTISLFNVVDLSNPRKPESLVWAVTPTVADILERASRETKTKPINREDLYWEAEKVVKGKNTRWSLTPVKARDLDEDFDMEPLDSDELAEFEKDMFDDRTAVTTVDSYDDLADLADSL